MSDVLLLEMPSVDRRLLKLDCSAVSALLFELVLVVPAVVDEVEVPVVPDAAVN